MKCIFCSGKKTTYGYCEANGVGIHPCAWCRIKDYNVQNKLYKSLSYAMKKAFFEEGKEHPFKLKLK